MTWRASASRSATCSVERPRARDVVDHAQAAEHLPVGRADGRAGVKSQVWLAGHERVGAGARVACEVRYLQDAGFGQHELAHRAVEVGLAGRKACAGLEPLAVAVDQADKRHRYGAEAAREMDDVVEAAFGRGVEDVERGERGQPRVLLDPDGTRDLVHGVASFTSPDGGRSRSGSPTSTATMRPLGA